MTYPLRLIKEALEAGELTQDWRDRANTVLLAHEPVGASPEAIDATEALLGRPLTDDERKAIEPCAPATYLIAVRTSKPQGGLEAGAVADHLKARGIERDGVFVATNFIETVKDAEKLRRFGLQLAATADDWMEDV